MRRARWAVFALLVGLLAVAALAGPRRWSVSPDFITGEVYDDHGPVAGARVRWKGDSHSVCTRHDGRFFLPDNAPARVTASKEGYFIAGSWAGDGPLRLQLRPLPATDNEDYAWVDPTPDPAHRHNCGNCHGEIYREWASSGHAHSAANRHFRNLFDGSDWHGRPNVGWNLLAEHPDGAGVCTACHAPTVTSFSDPAYTDLRKVAGVAAQGVHCDYCHKIAGVEDEEKRFGFAHGRFNLKLLRPSEGQLFFGPLDDVDRDEDAYSPLYKDSRYCASCHEGVVFGVHVYSTYSEWLNSPARREGKQCQTCHMQPTATMTNIAPDRGGIERDPLTLGNHRFFAGSREEMLRRCLTVNATLRRTDDGVRAEVTVRADDVGHRVPTGFVDRNLVLVVEGLDSSGRMVPVRDGPRLSEDAGKAWAAKPGRLYAKRLVGLDGQNPAPFWLAWNRPQDSRLLPGRADTSGYTFPPTMRSLRVRLIYHRFWPAVAEVKGWPDNEIVVSDQVVHQLE